MIKNFSKSKKFSKSKSFLKYKSKDPDAARPTGARDSDGRTLGAPGERRAAGRPGAQVHSGACTYIRRGVGRRCSPRSALVWFLIGVRRIPECERGSP
jgi:hypothetical protein